MTAGHTVERVRPRVWRAGCGYPARAPFHPASLFPELRPLGPAVYGDNRLYSAVRELFASLALDPERHATERWNPLARWIRPGMRVVVKPNWVKHESGPLEGVNALCTHPALVRVVVDYVLLALECRGEVVVADAPLQGADFALYRQRSGLDLVEEHYQERGLPVCFHDLRRERVEVDDETSFIRSRHALAGDPRGYSVVDLGERSRLAALPARGARFGVTDYDARVTDAHHGRGNARHSYVISNTALSADVIVSLPKLKTHLKTGMTGALKNFVGISGSKECLPHFRLGSPARGGDEFPDGNLASEAAGRLRPLLQARAPLWLWRILRDMTRAGGGQALRLVQGGGWHGNDTLWRTVHDLVEIARWYDVGGARRAAPRPILTLMDAIVAGEGPGPLEPRPRAMGLLLWGEDPGWVDVVAATRMGFDWRKIPLLARLADEAARSVSGFDGKVEPGDLPALAPGDVFAAPPGWAGRIEQ